MFQGESNSSNNSNHVQCKTSVSPANSEPGNALPRNDGEAEFEVHEGANSLEQQQEASGRSDTVIAHKPPTVPKDITVEPAQTYPEPSSGFPFPYGSMVTWLDPVQPDGLSVVPVNDDQIVSAPGSPTSTDGFMSLSLSGSQSSLIHRTVHGSDTTTYMKYGYVNHIVDVTPITPIHAD